MIDVAVLPIFFISIFFLAISPGPDLLLISSYSSTNGFKAGLAVAIGILLAGVIQTMMVALGLGQLMQIMPSVAVAIKLIGAIYLLWIGVNLIRSWLKNSVDQPEKLDLVESSATHLIYRGCLNNLLNPKALLFFSMFLPQFINTQSNYTGQILLLGLILSCFVFFINLAFALSFSSLGRLIGRILKVGRHADGLLGLIFVGLAARLATSE